MIHSDTISTALSRLSNHVRIIITIANNCTDTADTAPIIQDPWGGYAHCCDLAPQLTPALINRRISNGHMRALWTWTHPQEGRAAAALSRPLRTHRRVAHGGKVDWG